jgi:hypothetical protein
LVTVTYVEGAGHAIGDGGSVAAWWQHAEAWR